MDRLDRPRTAHARRHQQRTRILTYVLSVAFFLLYPTRAAVPSESVVTIGLVDTFSPEFYVKSYSPTVDHLMKSLPERTFRFVEIDYRNVGDEVLTKAPDFLLSAASVFGTLLYSAGAQQIATRNLLTSSNVAQTVASTFIVKNSSNFNTLSDLRGRRVAISDTTSFDGWLIAQGELARLGLDPDQHFSEIVETEYGIPDVAALVRLGMVDVGVLSTCEYERLLKAGLIANQDFRVLNKRADDGGCIRSTDRYPDVIFASLPKADSETVRQITVALLSMPETGVDAERFRWSVCNNFVPTFELLETLRLGPFAYLRDWSLEGMWTRWKTEILLGLLFVAAVLFHIVTVNVLVHRRTAELSDALVEVKRFYRDAHVARRQVESLERTGVVAQLSSLFAHEIKQPLMNISLYAGALRLFLSKKQMLTPEVSEILTSMNSEIDRSSEIVDHVRSYAKKRDRKVIPCDLAEIVHDVLKMFPPSHTEHLIHMGTFQRSMVLGDPFELQFICANFLKNALSAVKHLENPNIVIEIHPDPDAWRLTVTDNGPKLSDEAFDALGHVQESKKTDGLGFGLAIASAIAETNGGHLAFNRVYPQGLAASLILPRLVESQKKNSE